MRAGGGGEGGMRAGGGDEGGMHVSVLLNNRDNGIVNNMFISLVSISGKLMLVL